MSLPNRADRTEPTQRPDNRLRGRGPDHPDVAPATRDLVYDRAHAPSRACKTFAKRSRTKRQMLGDQSHLMETGPKVPGCPQSRPNPAGGSKVSRAFTPHPPTVQARKSVPHGTSDRTVLPFRSWSRRPTCVAPRPTSVALATSARADRSAQIIWRLSRPIPTSSDCRGRRMRGGGRSGGGGQRRGRPAVYVCLRGCLLDRHIQGVTASEQGSPKWCRGLWDRGTAMYRHAKRPR